MSNNVSIALVGICGYGQSYCRELIKEAKNDDFKINAVIDPAAEKSLFYQYFLDNNIPVYSDINEFYAENHADLVIISTPIQLHASHTCTALENGSNVLCEKPLCATIKDAEKMIKTAEQSEGFAAIGYQWSFTKSVQQLKNDYLSGTLGKAKRLKTMVLWPRRNSYYSRNSWVGRIKNANGDWVLDSPANNATAHYLHNMLYLTGNSTGESAIPSSIEVETYRSQKIENFDTAAIRCVTDNDIEILFYTTHSTDVRIGPLCCYEFEHATVLYQAGDKQNFIARFHDGTVKNYGSPCDDYTAKVWTCIDAVKNGTSVAAYDIKTALAHTRCINAVYTATPVAAVIPESYISTVKLDDDFQIAINNVVPYFSQCYATGLLLHELGDVPWSKQAAKIML